VRVYTLELIEAFGARRVMFGTDFPFALKVAATQPWLA
jgi:predicted TIM-barrel fold metal-dependent hydrolase